MSEPVVKKKSLFDRLINSSWQLIGVVAILLLLLAVVAAWLDGFALTLPIDENLLRPSFYPVMLVYILIVTRILSSYQEDEVSTLREISTLDDASFDARVNNSGANARKGTPIALAIGLAIGIITSVPWLLDGDFRWLDLYLVIVSSIMYALLIWVIYLAMLDTRLISGIESEPLEFDILYTRPFIVIGRQSLRVALAFVGGTTIALLFTYSPEEGFGIDELLSYGVIILFALLIFFLPMGQTHSLLRAAKIKELDRVNRRLADAYDALKGRTNEDGEGIVAFSTEVRLWQEYENRLKSVNTWPYEFGMLRTLLLSTLVPIAASQAQRLAASWLG